MIPRTHSHFKCQMLIQVFYILHMYNHAREPNTFPSSFLSTIRVAGSIPSVLNQGFFFLAPYNRRIVKQSRLGVRGIVGSPYFFLPCTTIVTLVGFDV